MRAPLLIAAAGLAACAGSAGAPAAPKAGSTIVRGRFIGYTLTPDSTVGIVGCRTAPGSERIRTDGSFELVALDCSPGVHRLVFGKNHSELLKFTIGGPVTDIGTIEGGP